MTRFPLHSAPQWIEEFGSPLYVYDAQTISAQYQRIANAFEPNISLGIHYACKALNNINVLKLLRSLGAGLDAVSIGEIRLGLHAGFAPEEILFTPNGVGMHEIREAAQLGVQINIDNLETLEVSPDAPYQEYEHDRISPKPGENTDCSWSQPISVLHGWCHASRQ